MLQSLGWQSLKQRRSDSPLCFFYKIYYGLVAVELPPYAVTLWDPSRTHILSYCRFITAVNYYKYSFYPLAFMQWNWLHCITAHIWFLQKGSVHHWCEQSVSMYNLGTFTGGPRHRTRSSRGTEVFVCLCWVFTAQSAQWGHVERSQFT